MNTANRVIWAIVGAILLALGVVGVLASLDRLPGFDASTPLLSDELTSTWRSWGAWAPIVSIVAGLVLIGLGALLFWTQIRRKRGITYPDVTIGHELTLGSRSGAGPAHASSRDSGLAGATDVDPKTLTRALSRDLRRTDGVQAAAAYLTGTQDEPWINLRLDLRPGVDLSRLHGQVDAAMDRFATTSGLPARLADVAVRIIDEPMSRVS